MSYLWKINSEYKQQCQFVCYSVANTKQLIYRQGALMKI